MRKGNIKSTSSKLATFGIFLKALPKGSKVNNKLSTETRSFRKFIQVIVQKTCFDSSLVGLADENEYLVVFDDGH